MPRACLSFFFGVSILSLHICLRPSNMQIAEFSQQALQNWLYYMLSTMTDNISELCKLVFIKSWYLLC